MTRLDEHLKLMQMGRQLLAVDMADLEATGGFDPIITTDAQQESDDYEAYYLQFPAEYRREAIEMAKYYQVFYCLENTIRDLVESQLEEAHGENWWETKAPEAIRLAVEKNKKREQGQRRDVEVLTPDRLHDVRRTFRDHQGALGHIRSHVQLQDRPRASHGWPESPSWPRGPLCASRRRRGASASPRRPVVLPADGVVASLAARSHDRSCYVARSISIA